MSRKNIAPADGSVISRPSELDAHDSSAIPARADGAVIIPAHNEADVIARTLAALAPLAAIDGIEVIVVCNGCTDSTAQIAATFENVAVVETDEASKTASMNLGDQTATAWPRLYLDADIEVDPRSVLEVFEALRAPGVRAARPWYVYDTVGASVPVRSYYRARSRAPAPPRRLWGAGGYAVSEEGHRRFNEFPHVTADDSWFDAQFGDDEKRVVMTSPMRVRTPRDTAGLLAVLTRQRRGYLELGMSSHAVPRGKALLASIRGPRSALDVGWYMLLTVASRRRAEKILRRTNERAWERDASSRTGTGEPR